jgi:hypothetical protein
MRSVAPLVMAALLAACGGSASSTPQSPTSVPSLKASPSAAPTRPELPDEMPVHPDAESMQQPPPDAIGAWTVDADPPAVYDFYLGALPAAGFDIGIAAPGGDAAIIRFSAPDGTDYQLDLVGHDPVEVVLGRPHD